MGNLTTALVFVLAINVFMFIVQASIIEINPGASQTYFNNSGSLINEFDANNGAGDPVLDTENVHTNLPSSEGAVSVGDNNFFTDVFNSIKGFFGDKLGLKYLVAIVSAPYNLLKSINLPNPIVFALGSLWYGVTFFLIVAFFWGRND